MHYCALLLSYVCFDFPSFLGVPFHGVHEKHNSNTLLFVRDASLYTQHSSHTVCHVSERPRKSASWALHNILRYNVNIPFQLGLTLILNWQLNVVLKFICFDPLSQQQKRRKWRCFCTAQNSFTRFRVSLKINLWQYINSDFDLSWGPDVLWRCDFDDNNWSSYFT